MRCLARPPSQWLQQLRNVGESIGTRRSGLRIGGGEADDRARKVPLGAPTRLASPGFSDSGVFISTVSANQAAHKVMRLKKSPVRLFTKPISSLTFTQSTLCAATTTSDLHRYCSILPRWMIQSDARQSARALIRKNLSQRGPRDLTEDQDPRQPKSPSLDEAEAPSNASLIVQRPTPRRRAVLIPQQRLVCALKIHIDKTSANLFSQPPPPQKSTRKSKPRKAFSMLMSHRSDLRNLQLPHQLPQQATEEQITAQHK